MATGGPGPAAAFPIAMPLSLTQLRPRDTAGPPPVTETELDRILKLIPTELVAFYAAASPLVAEVAWRHLAVALFTLELALAPVILFLDGRSTGQPARWPQYVVRTLVFATWAMAITWPFSPWLSGSTLSWPRSAGVLLVPLLGTVWLRERPSAAPAP
jgi:hypothetical protein